MRDELLQLLAELEAGLDFVDEDIEFISATELCERFGSAKQLLNDVAQQMESRHVALKKVQIVLTGSPNVGKSSLFNRLVEQLGSERAPRHAQYAPALVSPLRGTTRDYLTATISVDGMQCELVDTAGINETIGDRSEFDSHAARSPASAIDLSAQSLASERREQAAIRVFCVEAKSAVDDRQLLHSKGKLGPNCCDIVVLTKTDTAPSCVLNDHGLGATPFVLTSSRTGQGLEELCAAFGRLLSNEQTAERSCVVASTAGRCQESVRLAEASLTRAVELVQTGSGNELVALELRASLEEIGRVVGAIYTNDLLDRIFGTFCIGK